MRWQALLAQWRRWLTDPIRLYRECRLERVRFIDGPEDGLAFTVSLATREVGILYAPEGYLEVYGVYQRAGAGRFQWEEHQ